MTNAIGEESKPGIGQQLRTWLVHILSIPTVGPLLALVLTSAFFASQTDRFLTGQNWSLIVQQVIVVGTLAAGQTLVILTAGIDLSNGMIMAYSSVIMTSFAVDYGMNPLLTIAIGLLVSIAFGVLNGFLITAVRLPSFIVTLGTLNIAFAAVRIYTSTTIANLPDPLIFLGKTFDIGKTAITYGSVVLILLFLILLYLLQQTAWGRHVYAVGNNPEATRLAGISTTRLLISVYALAGLLYGIAGMLLVARTEVGDPQAGQTANLDSITAVVLGGTSLFGGRGNIMGTLVGALIVGVFRNGLLLIGIPSIYQVMITGILVILAVSVDQLSHRGQA